MLPSTSRRQKGALCLRSCKGSGFAGKSPSKAAEENKVTWQQVWLKCFTWEYEAREFSEAITIVVKTTGARGRFERAATSPGR